MKTKILATFLFMITMTTNAVATQIYGVVHSGFMVYEGQENFVSMDKFGGGLGIAYDVFSFLSLGAEFNYMRGSTNDPIPHSLREKRMPEAYGGFRYRGHNFVNVNYYELWLRPKLVIPIPLIKPYIATPISPLSMGGMRGYSVYGAGFGIVAGIQITLGLVDLFMESGSILRTRRGTADINSGPPWSMFDVTVPVNGGVGFSF